MNKKLIFGLTLVMVFALTVPAMADQFNDVPTNHWAHDSLEKVAQAGLIEGYQNGQFKGKEPLSRYQVAVLTSRVMDKVKAEDAEINEDVLQAIKTLATEFDSELAKIDSRLNDVQRVQITGETGVEYKDIKVNGSGQSYLDPYQQDIDGDDDIDEDDKVLAEDYFKQTATFNANVVKDGMKADLEMKTIGNYFGDTTEANPTGTNVELDSISGEISTEDFVATIGNEQDLGWKDYLFAEEENIDGVILKAGNSVVGLGQYLNDSGEEIRNIAAEQNNLFAMPLNAYLGMADNKDTEKQKVIVGLDAAYNLAGVDFVGDLALNSGDNEGKLARLEAKKGLGLIELEGNLENTENFVAIQADEDDFAETKKGFDLKATANIDKVEMSAKYEDYKYATKDEQETTLAALIKEDNSYNVYGVNLFGEYEYELKSKDELRYAEANKELGDITLAAIYDYENTTDTDRADKVASVAYAPEFNILGVKLSPEAKAAVIYDKDNKQNINQEANLAANYQVNDKLALNGGLGWAKKEDRVDITGEKVVADAGLEYQVTENSTASISYQKMDFSAEADADSFDREGITGNVSFKF